MATLVPGSAEPVWEAPMIPAIAAQAPLIPNTTMR